jgi:hypothetical protein
VLKPLVSGVTIIAIFTIVCEMAVVHGLIQVLQGHKGGGMDCGAKTVFYCVQSFSHPIMPRVPIVNKSLYCPTNALSYVKRSLY